MVNEVKDHMEKSLEEAKSALANGKDNMTRYYNQHHLLALECWAGDNKTRHPFLKLAHSSCSPYVIKRKVGRNVYRLKLLVSMACIHPVFNIAKVMPVLDDPIPR